MKYLAIFILFVSSVCFGDSFSRYWGLYGELWTGASGRIYDFSYAGYDNNGSNIPSYSVVNTVTATPDDAGTDTASIQASINSTSNGILYIPAGRYILDDILRIDNKDNLVIKGAGEGLTTLYFANDLEDLFGDSNNWRFGFGGMIWVGSTTITGAGWPAFGSFISNISGTATRGTTSVVLNSVSGIQANEYYIFRKGHNADYSLVMELHGDILPEGSLTVTGTTSHYWVGKVTGKSGTTINLENPLSSSWRNGWSNNLYTYTPRCTNIGIEDLTIECPDVAYLQEVGHKNVNSYNAISISDSQNCWIKNVTIKNADNGIVLHRLSCNNLISGVTIQSRTNRAYCTATVSYVSGHHGISVVASSHNNLIENVTLNSNYIHDLTVDTLSSGNVFRGISGDDLHLDHHSGMAHSNLFTDINTGSSTNVFLSSGWNVVPGDVPYSGAWEVFWNIKTGTGSTVAVPDWGLVSTNFPCSTDQALPDVFGRVGELEGSYILRGSDKIFPTELYEWQVIKRRGTAVPAVRVFGTGRVTFE